MQTIQKTIALVSIALAPFILAGCGKKNASPSVSPNPAQSASLVSPSAVTGQSANVDADIKGIDSDMSAVDGTDLNTVDLSDNQIIQ